MNKLVGEGPQGKFMMCILEPGNIERLKEGKAIEFHTKELFPHGLPAQMAVVIAFSETPVADARELYKVSDRFTDARTSIAKAKRPHCPECKSTVEQLGVMRAEAPVWTVFCANCGCAFGAMPPVEGLPK